MSASLSPAARNSPSFGGSPQRQMRQASASGSAAGFRACRFGEPPKLRDSSERRGNASPSFERICLAATV